MRTNPLALNQAVVDGLFTVIVEAFAAGPREVPARSERPAPAPSLWRGLFDRLDQWSWRQHQRATEAYLAKAHDVHDLEARIRDLERGARFTYY